MTTQHCSEARCPDIFYLANCCGIECCCFAVQILTRFPGFCFSTASKTSQSICKKYLSKFKLLERNYIFISLADIGDVRVAIVY